MCIDYSSIYTRNRSYSVVYRIWEWIKNHLNKWLSASYFRFLFFLSWDPYYNWTCEFENRSWRVVLDTTLYDKVVSDLRQVGGFLRFPPPIKLPRYNWNIVESGVKQHKPNHQFSKYLSTLVIIVHSWFPLRVSLTFI
jgi:hypothetical protein